MQTVRRLIFQDTIKGIYVLNQFKVVHQTKFSKADNN